MALSPEETNGGESTASDAPRSLPTPFLTKTYQLVDDRSIDDVISWNEDGSTFVVWNTTEFSRDLLPQYFKHNNFSSFVRQLNTYGFRKVIPDRWEFSHECFRRGEKRLLHEIKRRKVTSPAAAATEPGTATEADATVPAAPEPAPTTRSSSYSEEEQVISSNSWPAMATAPSLGSTTELIDENEKLRRENLKLNRELSQMKNLCGNIYALMSNYASNRAEGCSQAAKPLHLLPLMRFIEESDVAGGGDNHLKTVGGSSVRMFEVSAKRAREGEGEAAEQRQELQLQLGRVEVKSEPLDRRNGVDDHEISWLRLRESY